MIALVVIVVIAAVLALVVKPSFLGFTTNLKHDAVESYIQQNFSESNVTCNGGQNIEISQGKKFQCRGGDGRTFTVTLTDDSGTYEVAQN